MELTLIVVALSAIVGGLVVVAASVLRWAAVHRNDLLAAAYAKRRRPAFGCELRYAGTTEELALTQLSVTNAPVFGGLLQLSVPASSPDDRRLDMLAIEPVTRRSAS